MPQQDAGPSGAMPRNRPGDTSLTMGIVALVGSFIPVVGDFVAAPLGLLALLLGVLGVWNNERGLATNFGPSLIGATLGALALFIVLLMFSVTR
ncbi:MULTISPECIES: hypothetical protein [Streptomyces]|uniref:DUF4190 domain-containing protein n=1 Tax=Streptomyces liliifuscus TaxID=2797636 RepID=A0A7T7HZS4_9ACTN|nr:hypothetical protein [Streptomyces liliifuscus]QQM38288.1 hypothetical protein JEQ17_01520 [Streptomyces liliifuscus]